MRQLLLIFFGFVLLLSSNFVNYGYLIKGGIFLLGILLLLIGYYDLKSSIRIDAEFLRSKKKIIIENIRKNANWIIEVDLQKCELLNNSYNVLSGNSELTEVKIINSVFSPESSNIQIKKNLHVLKYKKASKTYFSKEIDMDIDKLKIKLFLQRKTFIYVNSYNDKDYYFDLEFLNSDYEF